MADEHSSRTPVQGAPIFATYEVVAQVQRDQGDLKGRVQRLETLQEEGAKSINDRLGQGAKTFSEIEKQVEVLNEKIQPKWTTIVPIALVVGGWIWVAARYPDPGKFETLQGQVQQLQMRQVEVNSELSGMNKALDALETRNARIEDKLDAVLRPAVPVIKVAP